MSVHADPEELVAYRAGQLEEMEVERLRDHFAICSECAWLLVDFTSFEEIEPRQTEESFAALMGKVEFEESEESIEVQAKPDTSFAPIGRVLEIVHRPPLWVRAVLPWAVAASMAVVAVGLGIQTANFRKVATGSKVVNFPIYDWSTLHQGGSIQGIGGSGFAVLSIPIPADIDRNAFSTYEIEVQDAQGREVESFSGLYSEHNLSVWIDRKLLDLQRYRFKLYGIGRGSGERQEISLPLPG